MVSFKIIDDDIDLNSLKNTDEADALADLLDTEGPLVAGRSFLSPFATGYHG